MNPYKVNRDHRWYKEISADSVEQFQLDGRLVWECYLFAASGVTPKQVVEFETKEQAYEWAISQGADMVTEFGLDRDNPKDELHFSEMRKFFDEHIQEMILKPHLPFCSRCGTDSPDYVLLLRTSDDSPLIFAACPNCRDELTLKQNAARAALKRIGV